MTDNPYQPIKTEVVGLNEESPTIKTVSLKPEKPLRFKVCRDDNTGRGRGAFYAVLFSV